MRSLATLKSVSKNLKTQLTKFETFIGKFVVNTDSLDELIERLEKVESSWNDFHDIQSELEGLEADEDSPKLLEVERDKFEEKYFKIVALAKSKRRQAIESQNKVARIQDVNTSVNKDLASSSISVKLPVLTLPSFDGSYDKWQQFHDTFKALIDENKGISDIQKFYYLNSALTGKANQVTESIEITGENYKVAFELLNKRFQNERLAINHHVKAIFDLNIVQKDSVTGLRELSDGLSEHLRSLENLKEPVDQWDTLIIHLISSKFDFVTKREWESKVITENYKKIQDLLDFLTVRCQILEATNQIKTRQFSNNINSFKGEHRLFNCESFISLPVVERFREIKRLRLCLNCFGSNHVVRDCEFRGCRTCGKKHHTLLHYSENNYKLNETRNSNCEVNRSDLNTQGLERESVVSTCVTKCTSRVLLATAFVYVYDNVGNKIEARVLLDRGSQPNFISRELSKKLGFKECQTNIIVQGVNIATTPTTKSVNITIYSKINNFKSDLSFIVIDQVTELVPPRKFDLDKCNIPENIILSDPSYNVPRGVDMLLGGTIFWELLCAQQIKLGKNQPLLQSTKLGWIIAGPSVPANCESSRCHETIFCGLVQTKLHEQMEKLWLIEECPDTVHWSAEETACEQNFVATHQRDESGRSTVALPLCEDVSELGESWDSAFRRLCSMERKLSKFPDRREQYVKFMREYESLNHMSLIPNPDQLTVKNYLPHHAIIRDSSKTTKLRVVFDASCKTSSGKSLNDIMMVGPTIQSELLDIVIRFRQHKFVLTGNINKMYRQIQMVPEHRKLQLILWREDPAEPPTTYELNTVTYGTAAAPFLAVRSLHQAAIECEEKYPRIAKIIKNDFYVDDLVTGGDKVAELLEVKTKISEILKSKGFELYKWNSNSSELVGSSESMEGAWEIGEETKTLGLYWMSKVDEFRFRVSLPEDTKITKRSILAGISLLYDPLGLVGPVIIAAKILLQRLWKLKIDWDDPVSADIESNWNEYKAQLSKISNLAIPRYALCPDSVTVELHGFSDASESAYGAAVYLKSIYPIWKALAWINGEPSQWKTFVSNRVSMIQSSTQKTQWRHVRSEDNPADMISRGISADQLSRSSLWWAGPQWLKLEAAEWPSREVLSLKAEETPEKRQKTVSLMTAGTSDLFSSISSLSKLRRIVGYCRRFAKNCQASKSGQKRLNGPLEMEELEEAMLILVRHCQEQEFGDEIGRLRKTTAVDPQSRLLNLHPFLDIDKLLRVGGRLSYSPLSYSQKFSIILPSSHPLTEKIIRFYHYRDLHSGAMALLATIREKFWILSARNTIRRVLYKCIVCFRRRPVSPNQLMENLPPVRVTPSRAFDNTGVDYGGPFTIKISRNKTDKAYLALFICMAKTAVHLELVSTLSTEGFLNALKRFIARRGKPTRMFSDNGKNFIGANRKLTELGKFLLEAKNQNYIVNFSSEQSIK